MQHSLFSVGQQIPPNTPHVCPLISLFNFFYSIPKAVSVSLPTWKDNVEYEQGKLHLSSGYPRFVIHVSISKLMALCNERYANCDLESSFIFPSNTIASKCRSFIQSKNASKKLKIRLIEQTLTPPFDTSAQKIRLFIVIFPQEMYNHVKAFWQHSGEIISSRFAEYCLLSWHADRFTKHDDNPDIKHLDFKLSLNMLPPLSLADADQTKYLEERFGRNWIPSLADHAKLTVRKRIAGIIGDSTEAGTPEPCDNRRSSGLTEQHVFLFPTGMSAIFNAHQLTLSFFENPLKTVQFGFPYTDTLKIQEKFANGCVFLGMGDDDDLRKLEFDILPHDHISALFCEFPSNPLLKSPNLQKIRELANEHDFLIVVDETIGNFLNVSVLSFADIVVSSLTKIFSGDSNVMAGSLVLNPNARHYEKLKGMMDETYQDNLWFEDAIFLERNSRTFSSRNDIINRNAEILVDLLIKHPKISTIQYPKMTTTELYHKCAVERNGKIGYGGLFSMTFHNEQDTMLFFDTLSFAKGPSLGTNFTLICPYTLLAHYNELEWSESYGVSRYLLRVSVGTEDAHVLVEGFMKALDLL